MNLKLMYITNDMDLAKIADKSGIDWVFVDLEVNGKEDRQGHLDTVISNHSIEDVYKIKSVLKNSKLLVRINPIYEQSKEEIEKVIDYGADIVMLPYFHTEQEVEKFIEFIDGRVKTCLLLETKKAMEKLERIKLIPGIDYIHVGLNDLHLDLQKKFMFELLIDGTLDRIFNELESTNIQYGFGGIARIGQGVLPAEKIIIEHYRRGSEMVILSRSFMQDEIIKFKNKKGLEDDFILNVKKIRDYEKKISRFNKNEFDENYADIVDSINIIKNNI